MRKALINAGLVAVLGAFGSGAVLAQPPREVPPTSSDALEYRCNYEHGSFVKHADGTYLCHFPNGSTISCDPDRCIQYLVGPTGSTNPRSPQIFNGGQMTLAQ
jgi:hypothetical protein